MLEIFNNSFLGHFYLWMAAGVVSAIVTCTLWFTDDGVATLAYQRYFLKPTWLKAILMTTSQWITAFVVTLLAYGLFRGVEMSVLSDDQGWFFLTYAVLVFAVVTWCYHRDWLKVYKRQQRYDAINNQCLVDDSKRQKTANKGQ